MGIRRRLAALDPSPHATETLHRGFSLCPHTIDDILRYARPLGHHEDRSELNLGFGFLYYGLVRTLRPSNVVVIGSGFGFSVVCLALGLRDNARGRLAFVDPSYSLINDGPFRTIGGTSQWDDPQKVQDRFSRFGVDHLLTHHRMRSDEFFHDYEARGLPQIDLAFIDGSHAFEDVKHDFVACARHGGTNSYLLLHDSNIYLREMVRHAGVKRWLNVVKTHKDAFEIVDFPFSSGVALVRVLQDDAWTCFDSRPSE